MEHGVFTINLNERLKANHFSLARVVVRQHCFGGDAQIMNLDLPTLMVMQSFVLACAGAVLFFAWLQNRIVSALALWGFANVSAAGGILSLMLGFTLHQPVWLGLGGSLLSF